MEVHKLCSVRDIYRAIGEFEQQFFDQFQLSFNEAMALCMLLEGNLSSGELAERLGLSNSNASKVIRSVEQKGFIKRILGDIDRRQMYFGLTAKGKKRIEAIKTAEIRFPSLLNDLIAEFNN